MKFEIGFLFSHTKGNCHKALQDITKSQYMTYCQDTTSVQVNQNSHIWDKHSFHKIVQLMPYRQTLLLENMESVKKGVGWVGENKNRYDVMNAACAAVT